MPQVVYAAKLSNYVVKLKPWTGTPTIFKATSADDKEAKEAALLCRRNVAKSAAYLDALTMSQIAALAKDKGCFQKMTKADHIWDIMTTCLQLDQKKGMASEPTSSRRHRSGETKTPPRVHLHSRATTVARKRGIRPTRIASRQ